LRACLRWASLHVPERMDGLWVLVLLGSGGAMNWYYGWERLLRDYSISTNTVLAFVDLNWIHWRMMTRLLACKWVWHPRRPTEWFQFSDFRVDAIDTTTAGRVMSILTTGLTCKWEKLTFPSSHWMISIVWLSSGRDWYNDCAWNNGYILIILSIFSVHFVLYSYQDALYTFKSCQGSSS
jgi:hypothetical protein